MVAMSRHFYILLALLSLVCTASTAWGHNGSFAMATTVDAITVDGDLRDWPRHLPHYPIENPGLWSASGGWR